MADESIGARRSIGVAISGGGHRATLWGVGVLLARVDLGLNRRVSVITSVSGGSIANGLVGLRTDYRTVDADRMRDAVRPAIHAGSFRRPRRRDLPLRPAVEPVDGRGIHSRRGDRDRANRLGSRGRSRVGHAPGAGVDHGRCPRDHRGGADTIRAPQRGDTARPRGGPLGDATLADLRPPSGGGGTRHIICATEMQSGIHAFFSDSFIYSYSFGLSTEIHNVPLSFAVQASAALPGAFAPRRLQTLPLRMRDAGGMTMTSAGQDVSMILMDGGVYDNMADQWFIGMSNRRTRWPAELAEKLPDVDDILIANASTGWSWRGFGGLTLRIRELRELAALGRIQSAMYNTIGRRRRSHLLDYWKARSPKERGAFVEVNDNPSERASTELAERIAAIAPDEGWASLVERTRTYPTILRRIDQPTATRILWHAYLVTALSAHRFFRTPVASQQLPTLAEFEASLGL